jgi:ribosomal protein L32
MDFLDKVVGPLSVLQWAGVLLGIVALTSIAGWMRRAKGTAAADAKLTDASCLGCGWKGRVSRYHRTCPKCGNNITRLSARDT